MPRFFFNLHGGLDVRDREGLILAGEEEALVEAIRNARDIMAEDVRRGLLCLNDSIEVVDTGGARVLTLAFRDAVAIEE
jgi:hypothetical protein